MKRLGSLLVIVFMLSLTTTMYGEQQAEELWEKTESQVNGGFLSVSATKDGGSISSGRISGALPGQKDNGYQDGVLAKHDANGNLQWQKQYGSNETDELWSTRETQDGGYIAAGYTRNQSATKRGDGWLVKTDANGKQQWSKQYGGEYFEMFYAVEQTADGGYLAAGSDDKRGLIVKTDANGNQKNFNLITEPQYQMYLYRSMKVSDNEYIFAGYVQYENTGYQSYIIKVDGNGNKIWSKTYSVGNHESISGCSLSADGNLIFTGTVSNTGFLLKLDRDGNMLWKKLYYPGELRGNRVIGVEDGYVLIGSKIINEKDSLYLIKTDLDGNEVFSQVLFDANAGNKYVSGFTRTADNGYVINGYGYTTWVAKFKIEELTAVTPTPNPTPQPNKPAPSDNTTSTTFEAASKAPSAGDVSNKGVWIVLLVGSLVVIKKTKEIFN